MRRRTVALFIRKAPEHNESPHATQRPAPYQHSSPTTSSSKEDIDPSTVDGMLKILGLDNPSMRRLLWMWVWGLVVVGTAGLIYQAKVDHAVTVASRMRELHMAEPSREDIEWAEEKRLKQRLKEEEAHRRIMRKE
ncbi:hypothetical protein DIPPA_05029 [Diplonema papillatum]|nr:hypothetical protein DIPPA_05029 [Diplonema papillatum]KAJ9442040.1 hypothetical protein DIPPA_05029 [Diplonema papillatum]KAJ9442041.1 hypothetical protein DIPPA_05029 [Diplonema papillatum]KAJ9442042.1 hypothetical protein DIPPA_05029 [Diplonema papillatum]